MKKLLLFALLIMFTLLLISCGECKHKTIVTDSAVAATCTEDGLTEGYHCADCGDVLMKQKNISALGHTWDNGTVTTAPTCTEAGTKTTTCFLCQATQNEEILALGHTEVIDSEEIDPTCTELGFTASSHCSACQVVLSAKTDIAALGHTWDNGTVTTAPTCTEAGTKTMTCFLCQATQNEEILALGHTEVIDSEEIDPTCTELGFTASSHCSACQVVLSAKTDIAALGHTWDNGTVTTAPTCTEAGTKTTTCFLCQATQNEEILALGHTEIIDAAVAPTCTENGLTEGRHCSVCPVIIEEQTPLPAKGHVYVDVNRVCTICQSTVYTDGLAYKLNVDETTYSVIGIGTATDADIAIPSEYNEKPVTAIAANAFQDLTTLTSVIVPNSVESIGSAAFDGCTGLTNITIPNSVTSIGYSAFYGCTGLTNITIPSSVTNIGFGAFDDCTGLNTVRISDIVAWCSVSFGNSSANPLSHAHNLYLNGALVTELVIPDGVTSIGKYAFFGCTGLTNITIPSSVASIGFGAFECCDKLVEICNESSLDITKGSSNNGMVGYYALNIYTPTVGASKLYTIEDGYVFYVNGETIYLLGYIGSDAEILLPVNYNGASYNIYPYAFAHCQNLVSVTIPDSVTSIGSFVFYNCTRLTNITISNSVTTIGEYAFRGCTSLESMTLPFVGATLDGRNNTHFGYIFGASKNSNNSDYVPVSLKTVVITGGTSIDSFAFNGCTGLTNITIPNSVTSIGEGAFWGCSSLESMTLPFVGGDANSTGKNAVFGYIFGDGNKKNYPGGLTIAQYYKGSSSSSTWTRYFTCMPASLRSVTITGGPILQAAFDGCSQLTNITLPEGISSIGTYAFRYCSNLTSITIPSSVTHIHDSAFYGCTRLATVHITDLAAWCNIEFDEYSFTNPLSKAQNLYLNGKLITDLIIPDGVTSIGNSAFSGCTGLTSITIPSSVTSIGNGAFSGCTGLTSITIPSSVTSIGNGAFSGCTGLTSITIPNSVISIGEDVFDGCNNLTYTEYNNARYLGNTKNLYYVLVDIIDATVTSFEIAEQTGIICNNAFENCINLVNITIPNSVKSIGSSAFRGCTSLESMTLPFVGATLDGRNNTNFGYIFGAPSYSDNSDYVPISLKTVVITGGESIGNRAFYNCTGLTNITIPNSVTTIGEYAFSGCTGLTNITIPNSVTTIGEYAFSGCTGLNTVRISDIVAWCSVSFGNSSANPLSHAHNLYLNGTLVTELVIPDSITSIGEYAFSGCTGLTNITISNSVTSIGSFAFDGCTGLTSITIPNSVTSIGSYAFRGCTSLESMTLPFVGATLDGRNNTHFGYIFGASKYSNNSDYLPVSLKTVVITGGESIGDNAFDGCTGLTNITIPNSVTSIGYSAFSKCTGLTSITIPNSVTTIDRYAFSDCTGLTNITIPNSVTSIGSYAFYNCTGLTNITIPNSVTSIGSYAFRGCTSLESMTLPFVGATRDDRNNTHFGYIFGAPSYSNNSAYVPVSLKTVVITGGESIGNSAFYNCTGLTNITIPNSVTSIGSYAFYGCTNLIYTEYDNALYLGNAENLYYVLIDIKDTAVNFFDIPAQTGIIYGEAFSGCTNLISITIPNSVKSIGYSAFYGCSNLQNITLPFVGNCVNTTDDIYQYPFGFIFGSSKYTGSVATKQYYYGSSTSTTTNSTYYIPISLNSVTITGGNMLYGAFYGCNYLTSITIPNSVTSIGSSAFYGCTGLTNITIPNSVTSIGSYAFRGCTSLESMSLPFVGATLDDRNNTHFGYIFGAPSYSNNKHYVPISLKTVVITGSESIGNSAFYNCTGLTNITIPNSVTSIGSYAFYGCTNLIYTEYDNALYLGNAENLYYVLIDIKDTAVNFFDIPAQTGIIYGEAFSGCTNLISITIPNSVTSIGSSTFSKCTGLTSITIPNSVTSIGSYAFSDCTGLTNITIPNSVTSIGSYAFYDCKGLTNITIPNSVTSIGANAFNGCKGLTSITIPNSVTSIGADAFYGCNNLTYTEYNNARYLGNAENLYYVLVDIIDATVTSFEIAEQTGIICNAFENCINLVSITIPNSVTSIGSYAFSDCTGLTNITIPNSVTSIGSSAFRGCTGLTSITIPNSVTNIGVYAFYSCYELQYIYFDGTIAQWHNIGYTGESDDYVTLHCTDGIYNIHI